MKGIFSPWPLGAISILAGLVALVSPNFWLWLASLVAINASFLILGGRHSYTVLLWIIGFSWLSIASDVMAADLAARDLSGGASAFGEAWFQVSHVKAILFGLSAIIALALGMRLATGIRQQANSPFGEDIVVSREGYLNRLVVCYFASVALGSVLGAVASYVPLIAQPVLAIALIKYVFTYLIARQVFENGVGYLWLLVIASLEIVTGLTGFFSGYKEALFVILIALASMRRVPNTGVWIFGAAVTVILIWVSLVWTVSKKEYRYQHFASPVEERITWMARRFFVDEIDYRKAVLGLFQRIGYTEYFAIIVANSDAGSLPTGAKFYTSAVLHTIKPRVLFPDKSELDDSQITKALTGIRIGADTSVSVGYVPEAYVDMGAPWFLFPIMAIGILLGAVARYFMSASIPWVVREAFATAVLYSSFRFETNIDKALGALIVGFMAMFLALKFGFPLVARWIYGEPKKNRRLARREMPI